MTFREYLRWEGWVAVVVGASLYAFGLASGHQGPVEAALSGGVITVGTGVFMVVRHGVPFRIPGAWFTSKPLASVMQDVAPCRRSSLLLSLLGEMAVATAATVGLSFLTGFWLTYRDFGVWAVVIGTIKIGPASTAIARHEARSGTTYRVAGRPLRGLVRLVGD